jgi:hypothetical protein
MYVYFLCTIKNLTIHYTSTLHVYAPLGNGAEFSLPQQHKLPPRAQWNSQSLLCKRLFLRVFAEGYHIPTISLCEPIPRLIADSHTCARGDLPRYRPDKLAYYPRRTRFSLPRCELNISLYDIAEVVLPLQQQAAQVGRVIGR